MGAIMLANPLAIMFQEKPAVRCSPFFVSFAMKAFVDYLIDGGRFTLESLVTIGGIR